MGGSDGVSGAVSGGAGVSFRRNVARLTAFLHKRRLDEELSEDMQAHLELAEADARARGFSPEEARFEARRQFGGMAQMQEEHRDRRSFRWMENLMKDFFYGLKSLRRTPGFTLIVVGVLALGIGGTVAMFSIADAVLLKPLPFRDPDKIVGVWEAPRPGVYNATTAQQFVTWKRLSESFAILTAEEEFSAALNEEDGPVQLEAMRVTPEFFDVFGVRAALGRTFRKEDEQEAVAVLSHSAWKTHFGGDRAILTKRIVVGGKSYQVVGVLEEMRV